MDPKHTQEFAREWIEAWNSHDLERILEHYDDDFEMTSPFIAQLMHEPSGTLRGKHRVGAYWAEALKRVPDLRFELVDVLAGVDSAIIYYRAAFGKLASEIFFFDQNGKIQKAIAHYSQPK